MPAPLLAVDTPFLLYRSFFALPDSIHGSEGKPLNALLGAANALLRIIADRSPRAVVMCFGAEAAHYRVELYPTYHAARPEVPEALAWQFAQAPGFFEQFGWPSETSPDHEADDLLGSLAAAEKTAGGEALLLTGDRDMYQCVGDGVSVLYLRAGNVEEIDPDEVKRRYGISPALVPDFIALRGDPSDGLPGAAGIGPKTAAELLTRHGSLEGAIAAAATERPRVAKALSEQADELRAFRRIAQLQMVEIERPVDRATDLEGGARAARGLGLNRLAERLEEAGDVASCSGVRLHRWH
jgi:DNA polymerase-1